MKILKKMKVMLSAVLVSLTLTFSVASSYQQGATAYASAVPVAVDGLIYLFEMALSGMGIAMTTDSFNDCYSSYKDYYYNYLYGTLSDEDRGKYATLEDLHKGDRINTQDYSSVIEEMQGFISNAVTLGNTISANSDGSVSVMSSMQAISNLYLGGVKVDSGLESKSISNPSKFLYIATLNNFSDSSYASTYSAKYTIYYSPYITSKGAYLYSQPVTTGCNKLSIKGISVSKPISYIDVAVSLSTGLLTRTGSGTCAYIYDNAPSPSEYWMKSKCNVPVFTSETLSVASAIGGLTLYQCLENAISIPDSIVIGGLDALDAVDDAIAKNPDATDDELAAAVTAAMAEQIAAEQETTQAVIEGNSWLEKIFNLLQSALNSIISALSAMGFLGTIVTLLQQVLSFPVEIAQQVAKVIPSYDVIVNAIQALPQAINGALDIPILGDILEVIISIPGTLADILEGLLTIPGVITDVVGGLTIPVPDLGILSDILEGVIAIPDALADVLEGVIAIPGIIVDAIESIFVIDVAVIDVAADELADTWEMKFPFIPAIKGMLNLSFPDTYDYPLIKVQTPSALKQFIHEDYIVLFDGEKYATQFRFVRSTLTAIFWIGFMYSLLNRFKVRLHIG